MCEIISCDDCGEVIVKPDHCGTGYARTTDGKVICYACCGKRDTEAMIATGKATLYLTFAQTPLPPRTHDHFTYFSRECGLWQRDSEGQYGKVSNWPGTLEFPLTYGKAGLHNMARTRYDVWFKGPDGARWYGVTYGDNTQICHCRRLKG